MVDVNKILKQALEDGAISDQLKKIQDLNKPKRVSFPKAKFSCLLSEVLRYEGNPCILLTSQGDRVDMTPYTWEEVDAIISKASK